MSPSLMLYTKEKENYHPLPNSSFGYPAHSLVQACSTHNSQAFAHDTRPCGACEMGERNTFPHKSEVECQSGFEKVMSSVCMVTYNTLPIHFVKTF